MTKALLLAAAATLTLAGTALAEDPSATSPATSTEARPTPIPDPGRPNRITSADNAGQASSATETNWIGAMVYDRRGTAVGRIEKVITGTEGGAPSQVQLRVRGKTVVIPTGTLTLTEGKAQSTLTLTQIEASGVENR